jgi:Ion channel
LTGPTSMASFGQWEELDLHSRGSVNSQLFVSVIRTARGGSEAKDRLPLEPSTARLFPRVAPDSPAPNLESDTSVLYLDPATFEHASNLIRSVANGESATASGHGWRMTYLSAVTITTLGFGDITPITAVSRMLVALEAMLGVLCAGMFVNALWASRIEERDAASPATKPDVNLANDQ